jgi:hypothetical protein
VLAVAGRGILLDAVMVGTAGCIGDETIPYGAWALRDADGRAGSRWERQAPLSVDHAGHPAVLGVGRAPRPAYRADGVPHLQRALGVGRPAVDSAPEWLTATVAREPWVIPRACDDSAICERDAIPRQAHAADGLHGGRAHPASGSATAWDTIINGYDLLAWLDAADFNPAQISGENARRGAKTEPKLTRLQDHVAEVQPLHQPLLRLVRDERHDRGLVVDPLCHDRVELAGVDAPHGVGQTLLPLLVGLGDE